MKLENREDAHGNLSLEGIVLYTQQEGVPPHYLFSIRPWLDINYSNKWIGKRGPVEWPPRPPDL